MITKVSHMSLFVLDQDRAYDFYVGKLGFKVNTDQKMDNGFRWLTVNPPDQPDLEIAILAPLVPPLGPLKKWASQRTLPRPAKQSFHQMWAARRRT